MSSVRKVFYIFDAIEFFKKEIGFLNCIISSLTLEYLSIQEYSCLF